MTKKLKENLSPVLSYEGYKFVLSLPLYRKMSQLLRVFNHPLRLRILEALRQVPQLSVTELCIRLRSDQPPMSQHLAAIRKGKICDANRQGQQVLYSLNPERLRQLNEAIQNLHPQPNPEASNELIFNAYNYHFAADLVRAVGHSLRMRIMDYIDKNPNCVVSDVYKGLNLDQSPTSQHIQILKRSQVLIAHKDGKFIRYRINYELLVAFNREIGKLFPTIPLQLPQ
jgi:DNA-binding transcriptional ArsR family regulator